MASESHRTPPYKGGAATLRLAGVAGLLSRSVLGCDWVATTGATEARLALQSQPRGGETEVRRRLPTTTRRLCPIRDPFLDSGQFLTTRRER